MLYTHRSCVLRGAWRLDGPFFPGTACIERIRIRTDHAKTSENFVCHDNFTFTPLINPTFNPKVYFSDILRKKILKFWEKKIRASNRVSKNISYKDLSKLKRTINFSTTISFWTKALSIFWFNHSTPNHRVCYFTISYIGMIHGLRFLLPVESDKSGRRVASLISTACYWSLGKNVRRFFFFSVYSMVPNQRTAFEKLSERGFGETYRWFWQK